MRVMYSVIFALYSENGQYHVHNFTWTVPHSGLGFPLFPNHKNEFIGFRVWVITVMIGLGKVSYS